MLNLVRYFIKKGDEYKTTDVYNLYQTTKEN